MNVDMTTFLWVAGTLLGVIGTLILVIWGIIWGAVKELRQQVAELDKKVGKRTQDIYARIEVERTERTTAHDNGLDRAFTEVRQVQDQVGDLRETVAGFGTVYITRQECVEKHREAH